MSAEIYAADIYEDGTPTLLARVYGTAGTPITQATCSSIAYSITDTTTNTVADSGSLTISAVIYDTLQTDAIWTKDATGYNFKWTPSATYLSAPGVTYAVEATITTTTSAKIQVPFALTTVPIVRS
jgi:hypothetical protein